MKSVKPLFFKLNVQKEDVEPILERLRARTENGASVQQRQTCTTMGVQVTDEDYITKYVLTLTLKSHPFHGEATRQVFEARVNWKERGFTVQYYYSMSPAGKEDENVVFYDPLYLPTMETMRSTLDAWASFYGFVQDISGE